MLGERTKPLESILFLWAESLEQRVSADKWEAEARGGWEEWEGQDAGSPNLSLVKSVLTLLSLIPLEEIRTGCV